MESRCGIPACRRIHAEALKQVATDQSIGLGARRPLHSHHSPPFIIIHPLHQSSSFITIRHHIHQASPFIIHSIHHSHIHSARGLRFLQSIRPPSAVHPCSQAPPFTQICSPVGACHR
jgi:hypothetical protein